MKYIICVCGYKCEQLDSFVYNLRDFNLILFFGNKIDF